MTMNILCDKCVCRDVCRFKNDFKEFVKAVDAATIDLEPNPQIGDIMIDDKRPWRRFGVIAACKDFVER